MKIEHERLINKLSIKLGTFNYAKPTITYSHIGQAKNTICLTYDLKPFTSITTHL